MPGSLSSRPPWARELKRLLSGFGTRHLVAPPVGA